MAQTRPQHDQEAEQRYLGCCLLEPTILARSPLAPEAFASVANRTLYLAMREVHEAGELNSVTLRSWLIDHGKMAAVGDALIEITGVIPVVELVDRWRDRLLALHRERSLALALAEAATMARGGKVEEAAQRSREALEQAQAAAPSWLADRWHPIGHDWLSVEPQPQRWLLSRDGVPVLASGIVGMLVAPGGRGKSLALISLALSVATGRPWLGTFQVERPGRVAVLMGEEDEPELRRRVYHTAKALGFDDRERRLAATRITAIGLAGKSSQIVTMNGETITRTEFFADLAARVADHELVILDPLSRFAPDVEGDNAHATAAITAMEHLAQVAKGTVLVAHHTAKWSRREGSKSGAAGARGVTALTDGVRWVASLNGTTEEDIELSVDKSNRAAAGEPVKLVRTPEGVLVPKESADGEPFEPDEDDGAEVEKVAAEIERAIVSSPGAITTRRDLERCVPRRTSLTSRAVSLLLRQGRITGGRGAAYSLVSRAAE